MPGLRCTIGHGPSVSARSRTASCSPRDSATMPRTWVGKCHVV